MHSVLLKLLDEVIRQSIAEAPSTFGYDTERFEGWYCIQIKPCTCIGCGRTVCYAEPNEYHVIIVWEEKDDRYLLKIAAKLKELGLDPHVVKYYPILGDCIPWEIAAELNARD